MEKFFVLDMYELLNIYNGLFVWDPVIAFTSDYKFASQSRDATSLLYLNRPAIAIPSLTLE